jgi:hypothetical protein
MMEKRHNTDVPRMTISFTAAERARLERLARRWGVPYSRALAMAVVHALSSLEREELIHTTLPSEPEPTDDDQTGESR